MGKSICPIFKEKKYVSRYVYSESKTEQKQILREQLNHLIDCTHPYCQNLLNRRVEVESKRADKMYRKVLV